MALKNITIHYFAIFREEAGKNEEHLQTEHSSAKELYLELKASRGFSLERENLRVAINDEFSEWETPIKDGDSVSFIPPVSGG